jgi:integrase
MAKNRKIPTYRHHKASGQAIVSLSGVDHYLGPYGTEVSKNEYDRVVGEWIVRGRRAAERNDSTVPLVKELLLAYLQHCQATMQAVEVEKIKAALRPVREMYGETPVREFDAVPFEAMRLRLVKSGLAVSTIRDRMGTVRRMVQWGVSRRMAPPDSLASIKAVSQLRARRDGVKPSKKVRPAPHEHIEAILPHVSPTIRAMVELQAHTGMRPGEV